MLYSYSRVSTDEQQNSSADQKARLAAYAERSGMALAREFCDEDISGSKTRLRDRPDGKVLCDLLQKGDTVVLTAVDRVFRSMSDAASQIQVWRACGVNVYFLDVGIDINTPEGEMMFHVLAAAAQYEARMLSKRLKSTFAYLRKNGLPYSRTRPFGWVRDGKVYKESPVERRTADLALGMRATGISYPGIALAFAKADRKKPVIPEGKRGYYSVQDVFYLCRAAQAGYPKTPPRSLRALPTAG